MANLRFTSSYIWRSCWFSIFGGRWEYFTILFEILTDENVGIDTKTKSLDSLIRKIFVIYWFHLISVLIRSITQNDTDKKLYEILPVELIRSITQNDTDKKLYEILPVENVGIDTKTKYLERLIRKIFVIEWFHLISILIRSITQNAMDNKLSIRQFPSPEHPYIAFPQKNLAVLDISRFTTGEIGPQSRLHVNNSRNSKQVSSVSGSGITASPTANNCWFSAGTNKHRDSSLFDGTHGSLATVAAYASATSSSLHFH